MAFGRGKVILLGEHGVVFGHPALATGIERGVTASAERAEADRLEIEPWGVALGPDAEDDEPLARAFAAVLSLYPGPRSPLRVRARVELPGGAGLGCSAALGVAVMGALDEALGVTRDADALGRESLAWERVFHGNPSGVDNAVSAAGGVVLFRRGEPLTAVSARRPLPLVVADSGEPSSTKTMVSGVARRREREPERVDGVFEAIAALVHNGRLAVEAGALGDLGQLMDVNHALLSTLLLSTTRLEDLVGVARDAGALGAKLTGAGGGGCMVALAADPDGAARVREALERAGAHAFVAEAR